MYELIKNSLWFYISTAAFIGLWILLFIYGTFKKTKNFKNKKIKTVLRVCVSSVLVCLWAWFVYINLYPFSLAKYEYDHAIVEEKTGVVENIERDGKDRINLIIDNTEYTIAYSSISHVVIIGIDTYDGDIVKFKFGVKSDYIDEGDTVKFKFGKKSKFIFDISEKP